MADERRRYFRINDQIGLMVELPDAIGANESAVAANLWDLMSDQDEKIERLLSQAESESPLVAELIRAFNQKLERIVGQLVLESDLVRRLAAQHQEVNISACGLGFFSESAVPVGTQLRLELCLMPSTRKIQVQGLVVGCDAQADGHYWRIDFCGMSQDAQEALIQHIVQRQSAQLKAQRNP